MQTQRQEREENQKRISPMREQAKRLKEKYRNADTRRAGADTEAKR